VVEADTNLQKSAITMKMYNLAFQQSVGLAQILLGAIMVIGFQKMHILS
jgi:hypothetical protein